MGNISSSSRNEVIDRKIPKHLQPIKRRHTTTKKKSQASINTAPLQKQTKSSSNQQPHYHQHINTLIPHNNTSVEINQIFNDYSASSPQLFRWTKGRRFPSQKSIPYPMPNDQTELDRQRVQFYVIRWAFESRHVVPPTIYQKLFEGIRVLDVGCGPGLWIGHPILDMAEDFQKSRFDALDVCNLLPTDSPAANRRCSLPAASKNFNFTCHNVLEAPLPFVSETFDYVQQSISTLAYKLEDWPVVLKELKRVTKRGGYIQLIEPDMYPQQLGPRGESWLEQIHHAIRSERNNEPRIACQLDSLLKEVGLADVTVRYVSVPIGSWGLDIGHLWEQNFDAFLESARPFLVDIMHISNAVYKSNTRKLKEELESGQFKAFNNIYMAYGRVI